MNDLHNKSLDGDSWGGASHSTSRRASSCNTSVRTDSITGEHSLYLFGDTSKSLIIDHI